MTSSLLFDSNLFFQRSCQHYLNLWGLQGKTNKQELAKRCRDKYPRGINLMIVDQKEIDNEMFTPHCCLLNRGRIFLNYDRLMNDAFDGKLPPYIADQCKLLIESYDPLKTILWLFCLQGNEEYTEFQIFTTDI